jgi:hypothetical protein
MNMTNRRLLLGTLAAAPVAGVTPAFASVLAERGEMVDVPAAVIR